MDDSVYLPRNNITGFKILSDDLYKLKFDNVFALSLLTMHHNDDIKCSLANESSVTCSIRVWVTYLN